MIIPKILAGFSLCLVLLSPYSARAEEPMKVYEFRQQMVYPEGRVDLRVEMKVSQSAKDFTDVLTIFVKNERAEEWTFHSTWPHIRFKAVEYTHDLTPEMTETRELIRVSRDASYRLAESVKIQYMVSSLSDRTIDLSTIRNSVAANFPWVVRNLSKPLSPPTPELFTERRISEGNRTFLLTEESGIFVLTRDDGISVRFPAETTNFQTAELKG